MWNGKIEENILYEDREIVVCYKSAGMAVQSARIGSMDMESALKNYLAVKQPGKVPYVGVVHRLDQPVEGVLVFAKTPRAAGELGRQMAAGQMGKRYLAVTCGIPPASKGALENYLKKDGKTNTSAVVKPDTPGGKKAVLQYHVLEEIEDAGAESGKKRLVSIRLETGRHHQIRVQMAHAGMPLVGDAKYHTPGRGGESLGLCSCSLEFAHPVTKKKMKFEAKPRGSAFNGFHMEELGTANREACKNE